MKGIITFVFAVVLLAMVVRVVSVATEFSCNYSPENVRACELSKTFEKDN